MKKFTVVEIMILSLVCVGVTGIAFKMNLPEISSKSVHQASRISGTENAHETKATITPYDFVNHPHPTARDSAAIRIITQVAQMGKIYMDGDFVVVELTYYLFPNDINKRLQFVRAFCDADAQLHHQLRHIFMYNPGDSLVGKCDPYNGVKLAE